MPKPGVGEAMHSDAKTPCRSENSEYACILLRPACVPGEEQAARLVGCVPLLESSVDAPGRVFCHVTDPRARPTRLPSSTMVSCSRIWRAGQTRSLVTITEQGGW